MIPLLSVLVRKVIIFIEACSIAVKLFSRSFRVMVDFCRMVDV